ncbi:cell wall-binding repeat-containing protein [Herbiconiux sp. A18JL235]|uniref:Cell wall-binding repeat-containing protein n=1 Tax=Herbiconiux sp. A18JL235 TaxID=3152363 RepID=A0AB39BIR1_9MICO
MATTVRPVVPDPTGDNIVGISMPVGASIQGTVSLTNGGSPEGAIVTVARSSRPVATRTVQAGGAFNVVGLAAGDYRVSATLPGNGPAAVDVPGVVLGQDYDVDLELQSPGVLSGTVTSSADGEPIAGVSVSRADQTAQTDSDGNYVLAGAKTGAYTVYFTDNVGAYLDLTTAPVAVQTAQAVDLDVELEPAAIITGIVRDSAGAPLPGVTVTSDEFGRPAQALSDFEGRYRLAGVPAGTYQLVGRPSEEPASSTSVETAGPTVTVEPGQTLDGVDFALDAFSVISGTLTRSAPVEGDLTKFSVMFISLEQFSEENHTARRRTVHPDASGRYEIKVPPGKYLIRITPPWNGNEYETTYDINWWQHIRGDFDYEYPDSSLSSGTKILVVERNSSADLDLNIDRGSPFSTVPDPVIQGKATPGNTLSVAAGSWSPQPTTVKYEWRRDNVPIPGATTLTYVVTDADVDRELTFAVSATLGSGQDTRVSQEIIPSRELSPTPEPVISGVPRVGGKLTANPGTWGPEPVSLAYQWNRNGAAIGGATGASYTVQQTDEAQKITVVVTGSKAGYPSKSITSKPVTIERTAPSVERIAGADRYEGSALISKTLAPDGSRLVYVASGEIFPDSLSGSAIAAQRNAPLLLATRTSVPDTVAAELARLAPADVVVLGGENTLTPAVVDQLRGIVPDAVITRIGGADRYEMSRNLIAHPKFGAAPSSKIFVATGRTFPDALSASPAAALHDSPVLLVDGTQTSLNDSEKALLKNRGVTSVITFGGPASLTPALITGFARTGAYVTKITGADRYAVSLNTAKKYFPTKFQRDTAYVAAGANFPDALTGGVLAGSGRAAPILLAQTQCVGSGVNDQILGMGAKKAVILGGPNSVAFTQFPFPTCS